MDVPPSRYRVEERGRRLVVVDRATGETVTGVHPEMGGSTARSTPAPASRQPDRAAPEPRKRAPGAATTLTTQGWYDDKGPRTLVIPESDSSTALVIVAVVAVAALVFWFFLGFVGVFVVGFFLIQSRKGVRGAITSWLDQYDIG